MKTIENLVEIAQIERQRLSELTRAMGECSPRELEATAKAVEETASNLSACLSRLAKHLNSLPASVEQSRSEPVHDPRHLELARRLFDLIGDDLCSAPESTAEPKLRARRATD